MTIGGDQWGIPFELLNADGSRAVFNDPTDPDYVGMAKFSGLDDGDVIEVADSHTERDGGIHGNFWRGRRPVIGTIEIAPASPTDANEKYDRMIRASNALRTDATLTFTPDGASEQFLRLRKNGPCRRSDDSTWVRKYNLPLIAADPWKYSTALSAITEADGLTATVNGSAETPPIITVNGPTTAVYLTNATTGQTVAIDVALGSTDYLIADFAARTVIENGVTNIYDLIIGAPDWWQLQSGDNVLEINQASSPQEIEDAGTGADVSGVGTVAWSGTGNVVSANNLYASCSLSSTGVTSHYLRGSNFGFSIPIGATITGVEATIEKANKGVIGGGGSFPCFCEDNVVSLVNASGVVVGNNKAINTGGIGWTGFDSPTVYGGPGDLWGVSWVPANINDSDFGVAISAVASSTAVNPAVPSVDVMTIKVFYTDAAGVDTYQVIWRDAWL